MTDHESNASSDLARSKAVIFTHFGSLRYGMVDELNDHLKNYIQIIKSYLECEHVAIVYAYVDWAVQQAVPQIRRTTEGSFTVNAELLLQEQALLDLLEMAEIYARKELGFDRAHAPRFHYIGIIHLVHLLNNLVAVDQELTGFLSGGKVFTYDSPKFVEAVIRLARGITPHLAPHPVIRIDEDAVPNSNAIGLLLEAQQEISYKAPFYFFSGTYGTPDGDYDPINDHAVRTAWFFPVGTKAGDKISDDRIALARQFLADLDQVGATQIENSADYYSSALRRELGAGRKPNSPVRKSAQVISGAGLIMSSRAVSLLPPFMNFKNLTTWVDDHLKRRFHEALSDLGQNDLESLSTAKIRQNRHPKGTTQGDIEWTSDKYLDRLLRGCLFRRIITHLDGRATAYSVLIGRIVQFQVNEASPELPGKLDELRAEMTTQAKERYEEVLKCWSSAEFNETASFDWATTRTPAHQEEICSAVVEDAMNYIQLVLKWPIFTKAIDRLPFLGNWWLFDPVD